MLESTLTELNRYYFKFLSAENYGLFFQKLRKGEYPGFKSKLEVDLEL